MKLSFVDTDRNILVTLKELQKTLPFSLDETGVRVKLQQGGLGLNVQRSGNAATIQYEHLPALCRALWELISRPQNLEWSTTQKSNFRELGLMADVSRNAVLNLTTCKQLVRTLACLGYNQFALYMEDTIEVEGEPYFGYMRGALTKDELREIDRYCMLFGIELIPYVQTLAHLNQITRFEEYKSCIDVDDILLVGEERTYLLLERLFQTITQTFSGKKINIGMDEAHMLGLGKYLEKHGYEKRFDIMLKHLQRVQALCHKYELQPSMWSDMFFRLAYGGNYYVSNAETQPDSFAEIPKDITLVYWDYYSCDPKRYQSMLSKHLQITEKVAFAGGLWKWADFAPDNSYSIEKGKHALKACKEQAIPSVILTAWGDDGAETSIFSILPALFYDAELAYGDDVATEKFAYVSGGIAFDDFMTLDMINKFTQEKNKHSNASKYFLFNDPLFGTFDSLIPKNIATHYKQVAQTLAQNVNHKTYGYLFHTLQKLCESLELKADLSVRLKDAYDRKDRKLLNIVAQTEIPQLLQRLEYFYQALEAQWHRENKAFGFEVQCIRLGGLQKRLSYTQKKIFAFLNNELGSIEELEEERKPYAYFPRRDLSQFYANSWAQAVSPSVI